MILNVPTPCRKTNFSLGKNSLIPTLPITWDLVMLSHHSSIPNTYKIMSIALASPLHGREALAVPTVLRGTLGAQTEHLASNIASTNGADFQHAVLSQGTSFTC